LSKEKKANQLSAQKVEEHNKFHWNNDDIKIDNDIQCTFITSTRKLAYTTNPLK